MSDFNEHPDEPKEADDLLPSAPVREKPMGFWDHLEELRGTIIKSVVAFLVCAVLVGVFLNEFYGVLLGPLKQLAETHPDAVTQLTTLKIAEVFTIIIQMCLMGGFVLAAPFILYFVAQFVAPALTEKELRAVLPMCISALVLFLLGAAFGFFLLMPKTLEVSHELAKAFDLDMQWTVGDYFNTLAWLVLGVGGAFEFPLIIVLLVWLGVLSTAFLKKYRRHAIIVVFLISAIITPTTDPITQATFAAPLYLLYEISIIVGARIEKRRERKLFGK